MISPIPANHRRLERSRHCELLETGRGVAAEAMHPCFVRLLTTINQSLASAMESTG
jgi:hypothetical protein